MTRFFLTLLLVLVVATLPAHSAGLPDTGQTTCYNGSGADGVVPASAASIARDDGTHPRQDCRYGLDAAAEAGAAKTGGGAKGFDYTKVANNGTTLAASVALGTANTAWACTRDNITGLTWEVKTSGTPDLSYSGNVYTWYSSDSSTNGGNAGSLGGATCTDTVPDNQCNTHAFVAAVNAAALCTYTDWRLPTRRELLTLVYADKSIPSIDPSYFPNLPATSFWTASTYVSGPSNAWYVDFSDGYSNAAGKSLPNAVRLVRGGPAVEATAAACTAGNPNASLVQATPTSAFTNNGNGTVTHGPTGLMWKRCVQGESGASCSGAATPMTWMAALAASVADNTAGYGDWRLPNSKELESLVETCGFNPSINQTVFPGKQALFFWTGTTYAADPANAWFVNFNLGYASNYLKTSSFAVRLVRAGQSHDALAPILRKTVVEYRDTIDFPGSPGGHFFYTADPMEQAAVDAGAAGAFSRTGREFLTGGTSPLCRFYGSTSPGPNSHFFTVDLDECNFLRAAQITPPPATVQQWNYEGSGYATTPVIVAANGERSCPANTIPLYRAYNNAYPGTGLKNRWDSNHRITSQRADIDAMVSIGWRDEGIVFCGAL